MIEICLLRYALAAAETGSFTRAAEQFGMKQSTLSRHIHYLEDRVGLALFRRSTHGVVPTDRGEGFLRSARRIVRDMESLDQECATIARGGTNLLRFGFQGSLHSGELSALFRSFRETYPSIEMAARERGRTHLLRAIEREELDLAVVGGLCDRADIQSVPLWYEPVILCLAHDHVLARRDRLYWTDLRAERFVVGADDPGPDLSDLVQSRLSGPGHRPTIVVQQVRRDNLPAFASGDDIVLLVGPPPALPGNPCVLRTVHDAFGQTSIEYRAHWHRENESTALRWFLDTLGKRQGIGIPN